MTGTGLIQRPVRSVGGLVLASVLDIKTDKPEDKISPPVTVLPSGFDGIDKVRECLLQLRDKGQTHVSIPIKKSAFAEYREALGDSAVKVIRTIGLRSMLCVDLSKIEA